MKLDSVCIGVIAIGAVGILTSIFNVMGDSKTEVMVGIMISGAILCGAGLIATVIAKRK